VKNYPLKVLWQSAFYPLLFMAAVWLVYAMQLNYSDRLVPWGILPREAKGIPGIVTSVFIHGDFNHLLSNTFPMLVLGTLLFYFYKKIAKQAFLWVWLISGLWLWVGGRNNIQHPNYHIGASTLVYGLATFLFFSGVFRKHLRLMVVSALVVFLYGSIVWGMFPIKTDISWEGHLFGAIAGVLVAFNYRKEGPQRREYVWENEEESESEEESGNESEKEPRNLSGESGRQSEKQSESENGEQQSLTNQNAVNIRYVYKQKLE
jgi:membrane associated rhomboid family serine protease